MKRTSIVALFIALGAATQAQGLEQTMKLEVASQNVWRGQVFTDGFVFNPSFDFGLAAGTHLIAWGSFDLEDKGTDEWRFTLMQNFNLVAMSGSIGATHFSRELGFPDTTEIFASAKLIAVPFSISLHRDVDVVEGTYARLTMGAGIPKIGFGGANFSMDWSLWLGYSDENFASWYYGDTSAGLADAGFRLQGNFGVVMGTISVWVQGVTLLSPDYTMTTGDRATATAGVSWSMKF